MASAPLRLSHGPVQASAVSASAAARLRTEGVYKYVDNLVEIGTFVADNTGYVTFPIGEYTYRLWTISLIAPAVIAAVTDAREGENVVKTAKITDYIDTFIIEINGVNKWEMKASELQALNAYQNLDTTEGELRIAFGSPNIHNLDMVEDAYQFGTANLRSVKLRVKTKPAWVSGMRISIGTEFAPTRRPLGYWQSTTRYGYTAPGAGTYSMTELAVGVDFAQIWVMGTGIKSLVFTIDREKVLECTAWKLRALNDAWGKDMNLLGAGIMIDNFRDGDGVGFDSITDQQVERARGADVRLDLNMAAATTLSVIVFHCGLFSQQ